VTSKKEWCRKGLRNECQLELQKGRAAACMLRRRGDGDTAVKGSQHLHQVCLLDTLVLEACADLARYRKIQVVMCILAYCKRLLPCCSWRSMGPQAYSSIRLSARAETINYVGQAQQRALDSMRTKSQNKACGLWT